MKWTTKDPDNYTSEDGRTFMKLLKEIDYDTLNEWEENFLSSLESKMKIRGRNFAITEPQMDTLLKIANKH